MVKVLASHRSFFVNDECTLCTRRISSKKSSNLRRHLERFHSVELAEFDKSTPPLRIRRVEEGQEVSEGKQQHSNKQLSNELIEFFISTGLSLDHLQNKHLRELLNAIPNFAIPSLEEVQIQMAIKLLPPLNVTFEESMKETQNHDKEQQEQPLPPSQNQK